MIDFADAILLISALVLILGVIPAIRGLLGDHDGNAASFRDYFGPEYDRDLLQQSKLSETDEWLADDDSRLPSFRLHDLEGHERSSIIVRRTRRDHRQFRIL
jgi:hypothetical protein